MRRVAVGLLFLGGCKVVDAPEDLEALMVYGFENYNRNGDEYLVAMGDNLLPQVDEQYDAIAEGYRIDSLTQEQIEAAGIEDAAVTEVFGAMGALTYRHPVPDIMGPILAPNRSELFPDNLVAYTVLDETEGDRDCFAARTCDRYDFTFEEVADVGLLGNSTRTVQTSVRWVYPATGEPYVVSIGLCPDGIAFNTNLLVVHQQYNLAVVYPYGDVARRVEAFWVDAEVIGMDVPDHYAVDQAVGAMAAQGERIDDYLDEATGVSTEPD